MSGIPSVEHHAECLCYPCVDHKMRVVAFGRIRSAAAYARRADAWDPYHGHLIRQAIRGAIGSEKT